MLTAVPFFFLPQKHWFEGYRIESQNGNQIGLEMDLQNLIRALRSAAAADEITVKLAKKGVPVLTFDIATPLGPILQDVPVSVLSAARLAECVEPVIESVCGFTLPTLTRLHAFIERMRGLGNRIELLATVGERHSELCVQMLTDNVSVATSYQKLARAGMVGDEESVSELEVEKFSASVDLRNLRCALFGHQLAPKHALCFILKTCVMVHLMGDGDGSADVSYYIPKFFD